MSSSKVQSDRVLQRRYSRTLGLTALRLLGSEGRLGRLRRRFLEAVAQRPDTVILQIGANDGVFDDPLFSFFKDYPHVRGILVEPQAGPYAELTALYEGNPNITCVRTAIAKEIGEITLWSVNLGEDHFGKVIARENPEKLPYAMWRRPRRRLRGYELESEVVPAMPLSNVLEQANIDPRQISALFTDTEGQDVEVVSQLMRSGARPGVIQYEHIIADDQAVLETNRRLNSEGYDLSWSFRDIFAVLRT